MILGEFMAYFEDFSALLRDRIITGYDTLHHTLYLVFTGKLNRQSLLEGSPLSALLRFTLPGLSSSIKIFLQRSFSAFVLLPRLW